MWGEEKKYEALICLTLSCFQLKIDCYEYKIFYVSLKKTTNQNPIAVTQKIMKGI